MVELYKEFLSKLKNEKTELESVDVNIEIERKLMIVREQIAQEEMTQLEEKIKDKEYEIKATENIINRLESEIQVETQNNENMEG